VVLASNTVPIIHTRERVAVSAVFVPRLRSCICGLPVLLDMDVAGVLRPIELKAE
jgi:hypothetical protein